MLSCCTALSLYSPNFVFRQMFLFVRFFRDNKAASKRASSHHHLSSAIWLLRARRGPGARSRLIQVKPLQAG